MNNEEKILTLLEQMATRQNQAEALLETVAIEVKTINDRLVRVEESIVRIENDHGSKPSALFDGYQQNADKLDRIEKEVSRQEEIILRKVF